MTDFSDRKYLKRRESEGFWQFQYERDPIKESKSFYDKDKKYGSKAASFAAAKAHRDEFLRAAHELGLAAVDGSPNSFDLPIQLSLSPRNTSGIIGLYRENLPRAGRKSPEMNWVANYKDDLGHHDQKAFPIRTLGEKEALLSALRFRRDYVAKVALTVDVPAKRELIDKHVQELDLLLEYIDNLVEEDDLYFFLSTINSQDIPATEKQSILAIRIGQTRFRKLVIAVWQGRCAITGATQFLTAGHIKPWSESNDAERLDPFNGLALSPVYDKAFDAGLITFEDSGRIRLSPRLLTNAPLLGITGREEIAGLSDRHHPYLEYHRTHRFRTK
ncbi:MAG: HNH endonuclease [Nitrosomonadales bacterium]|nr:HNH endonuclease [Nitrosomonadales bacterium]